MFDNPGTKLKSLAKILFCIEFPASILAAIVMFGLSSGSYGDEAGTFMRLSFAFLVMPVFLYVANLLIYSLGTLVKRAANIDSEMNDIKLLLSDDSKKKLPQIKKETEYVENLDKMLADGTINEKEYEEAEKSKDAAISDRLEKLTKLHEKGLITPEEYKKALLEETKNDESKE